MRRPMLTILMLLGAVVLAVASPAEATPGSGISSRFVAVGTFAERLDAHEHFADGSKLRLSTSAPFGVAVIETTLAPGGSTGWHSHDGTAIVTVSSGTVTAYLPGRGGCEPTTLPAGSATTESGLPHVLRNETAVPATFVVTMLYSPTGTFRIDQPVPDVCRGLS